MKYILVLIFFFPWKLFGQDTTAVSHGTEMAEDFAPTRLVDQFEQAFGLDREIKFRAKVGLRGYQNSMFNTTKTGELSFEKSLGRKNSLKLDVYQKPRQVGYNGLRFLIADAEFRHYFKSPGGVNNLSGQYLGLSASFNFTDGQSPYGKNMRMYYAGYPYQNRYFYEMNIGQIKLGQQFGSLLDLGVKAGVKRARRGEVAESGVLLPENKASLILPYLSSYSTISLGVDFPLFRKEKENCSFMNCNEKVNHLLKADLSGLFYLDPFEQNIQSDFNYEQKLGKWPVSVLIGAGMGLNRSSRFIENGSYVVPDEPGMISTYANSTRFKTLFALDIYSELRVYPFQKRELAKGLKAEGLHGWYLGGYVIKSVFDNRFPRYSESSQLSFTKLPFVVGPVLGYQKKISTKYFIDVGSRFQDDRRYNWQIGKVIFNPYFKFGYAF